MGKVKIATSKTATGGHSSNTSQGEFQIKSSLSPRRLKLNIFKVMMSRLNFQAVN
jgi:hypothetical protein